MQSFPTNRGQRNRQQGGFSAPNAANVKKHSLRQQFTLYVVRDVFKGGDRRVRAFRKHSTSCIERQHPIIVCYP